MEIGEKARDVIHTGAVFLTVAALARFGLRHQAKRALKNFDASSNYLTEMKSVDIFKLSTDAAKDVMDANARVQSSLFDSLFGRFGFDIRTRFLNLFSLPKLRFRLDKVGLKGLLDTFVGRKLMRRYDDMCEPGATNLMRHVDVANQAYYQGVKKTAFEKMLDEDLGQNVFDNGILFSIRQLFAKKNGGKSGLN